MRPDPDAFAKLICDWCVEAREGDHVVVATTVPSLPLAQALHGAILERGAWPLMRFAADVFAESFYANAGDEQLDGFAPLELSETQGADAFIGISAPTNTRALAAVDPARITRMARARAPLQEARLESRWCGTLWPTAAAAQEAGMSEANYAEFVTGALFLDRPDPAIAWRELSESQQQLVDRLVPAREIRIEAADTDLRLRVDGRTWVNSDGKHNMPSGEVFTGPLEDSANGTIRFTVPSNTRGGGKVADVQLTFEQGRVVQARAQQGDDHLQAALETDRGARFLGELGIGTNVGIDRATGSTLLDEKMAGTVHLALGRSYPQTGGTNASALHWDLICDLRDGGTLSVDGETLSLTGR
ncbi:MAG TPA: aminopeptidase [Solirubrobacteraceae bacterium]